MFDELFLSLWEPQSLYWLRISFMGLKWENCSVIGQWGIHTLALYSFFFAQFVAYDSFQHPRKETFAFSFKTTFFYGCSPDLGLAVMAWFEIWTGFKVNLSWRIDHPS